MARIVGSRSLLGALVLVPMLAAASCSAPDEPGATGADAGADVTTSDDAGNTDGGDHDAGPDARLGPDLERDYCTPSAALVCSRAQSCGCGDIVPGGALDLEACTTRVAAECMASWGQFLTAGAKLDQAAATACIAKLDAATPACAAPSGRVVFAACAPFMIDPANIGETCKTPYCAGGSGRCIEGKCAAAPAAGAQCQNEYTCATGFVCSPAKGTCVAQGNAGTTCEVTEECAPPLACIGGACKALGAVGAMCTNADECATGLVCNGGSCAAAPATCAQASECGQGQICGGARTCAARAGAGAACLEDRDCGPSLYCDDAGHTCIARPAQNEPCAKGIVCAPGLGCSLDNGTCLPLPGNGETCAAGEPFCAGNLGCNDFTCGPLPAAGAPCTVDNRCADGLACDFGGKGSTCITPRAVGEECTSDRSCAAGLFCGSANTCEAGRPAGAACSSSSQCAGACAPDKSGGLSCRAPLAAADPCVSSDDCPDTLRCAPQPTKCLAEVCTAL